jgi:selenocysteine-specific elongation factor
VKNVIIGTAGHIDHGKTSLVKALTGINTDRLEEEKRRGITIDIGFAHMELDDYRLGFIDVPGHEKFVKNMLAGIGGVHLLLLVVAADESVMPQTREHLQICRLLGISHGIVVITKKGLVDSEFVSLVEEETSELTKGTFLEGAPILAVDSCSGQGIPELKDEIQNQLDRMLTQQPCDFSVSHVFRLPIDRVFSIKGFGTVVTGTTLTGTLKKESTVAVYPAGKPVKVRGIEVFNQEASEATSGQRTAVNLSGVDKLDLARGMFLSVARLLHANDVLNSTVKLLEDAPGPLKQRSPVRFHHGSAEIIGRIYLLDSNELQPGERALAQIRLDHPTLCFPGDSFILRRYSPLTTVGGGLVLDNHPRRVRKKDLTSLLPKLSELALSFLAQNNEASVLLKYLISDQGIAGADYDFLVSRTGLTQEKIKSELDSLSSMTTVPILPPRVVCKESIADLKAAILKFLQEFHQRNPLAAGVSREELKGKFLREANSAYFQFLLASLEEQRAIELRGSLVGLHGRQTSLSDTQSEIKQHLMGSFHRDTPQPVPLTDLASRLPYSDSEVRTVCYYLIENDELLRISEDFILLPEQLESIKMKISSAFPVGTNFSVPQFKDLLKLSRKYAIPLLEYLDRKRITQRRGDTRSLIKHD